MKLKINKRFFNEISYFFILIGLFISNFFDINSFFQILICLIPIIIMFIQSRCLLKLKKNYILLIFILWITYNVINLMINYSEYYIRVIFFQIIVFIILLIASNVSIEVNNTLKKQFQSLSLLCILLLIIGLVDGGDENSFIFFTISLLPFVFFSFKHELIAGLFLTIIYFILEARSAMLTCILFTILYYTIKRITNKKWYILLFVISFIFILLIPHLYIFIYHSESSTALNILSRNIFGKNLFSGRNILWIQFDNLINGYELFGLGGYFLSSNSGFEHSVHNLFLFLIGQGGYILLFLFFILMLKIYISFYDYLDNKFILISAAYIISILFRSSFDLMLMANRFIESISIWFTIGIAIAIINSLKKKGEV